jgi:hypothetical protein
MTRLIACAMCVAVFAATLSATVDPRLATVTKAYVAAVDDHDEGVTNCVSDHLRAKTALHAVTTKDAADVILRIKAHLTNSASRTIFGRWGASPSARLEPQLPDGTPIWAVSAKYERGAGTITRARNIECGVADGLLAALKGAMGKAREGAQGPAKD